MCLSVNTKPGIIAALRWHATMILQQEWFYIQIAKFALWWFQILQKNSLFSSRIAGAGSEIAVVAKRCQTFQGVQQERIKA